ncbi:FAD/NAD(P)-binding protein [Flagellimonas sp. 389]|uniref:FAD/NAD(P)-binding protein n=1 Tax=Flagellimonas sp. 389 TaxID=2835862 RepID=UPI001BD479D3|nr:FAD/NAD(P)-binding protein [Flagellimonas sp. 389]MBS9464278.1 FAD/NAD(P)-binding protein [Flagellimonas sp. 389]
MACSTIGIVGIGPRGLSAMESLFLEASRYKSMVKVLAFEPFNYPGAGPVYDLGQPKTNWLNVTTRALDIPAREEVSFHDFHIPYFPTFQEWSGYNAKKLDKEAIDKFPLRSELGQYLHDRYLSITAVLKPLGLYNLIKREVTTITFTNESVSITDSGDNSHTVDEIVLCVGHQPTYQDEQMAHWLKRSNDSAELQLFKMPYPVKMFQDKLGNTSRPSVGVRGFGLAMIDVCRALSEGVGGTFTVMDTMTRKMVYEPSGKEPDRIVPFSLDGLPMAPKPLNRKIDEHYVVTDEELTNYVAFIDNRLNSTNTINSPEFLIKAITPIIAKKFTQLSNLTIPHKLSNQGLETIIEAWLLDSDFEHDLILPKQLSTKTLLQKFVAMATHTTKISLDYVIGHVWRHCQPTMYKTLSFAPLKDEVIAKVIDLDERLKRYSYGPPVDSLQQLLALSDVNLLTFDVVNNPDVTATKEGWELSKGEESIHVDTMINSVLDTPKLSLVKSKLIEQLREDSIVQPLHNDLAIETQKDGTLISRSEHLKLPISVLGRLAKGTLIGVDAIAECFGVRSKFWAKGVFHRVLNAETTTQTSASKPT